MAVGLTTLALSLMAVGTVAQTAGQLRAGGAAKRAGQAAGAAAEDEAQLADYNAAVADVQAKDAIERGYEEENRFRVQVKQAIGNMRTGFGASGVDVGYGSAAETQVDAAQLGELDALTLRTNAAREAWGFKVAAEDYRRRATITRRGGSFAVRAGAEQQTAARFGAATSLLGTGSSLFAAKYGFGGAR